MGSDNEIRSGFVRTDDGVDLYYRSIGEGPPIICCNGVGVSTFFWKYVVSHFRDRFQIVLWDYRGHGRSGSPTDVHHADVSMERNALDLRAVIQHVSLSELPVLMGHSMGCQVILEFYNHFPKECRALVPMFGTFARPLDTFMDFKHSRTIFEGIRKVATLSGRSGRRLFRPLMANPLGFTIGHWTGLIDGHYAHPDDIALYMEHLNQLDQELFFRMVSQMSDHDLTDLLPNITLPVLVFAAEKDLFTPLHRAQTMADLIPNAELMVLAEASHAAIVEHPKTINQRVDRFFLERVFCSD